MKFTKIHFIIILYIFFLGFFISFYNDLKIIFEFFVLNYGYFGLSIIIFLMDLVVQPISPDVLIFGSTFGGANIFLTAIIGGLASSFGGIGGYFLGKKLGQHFFEKYFDKTHLQKGKLLFENYGILAVIIGAITPIPYSAVCWGAGIYNMKFLPFIISSIIIRTLRFLLIAVIGFYF